MSNLFLNDTINILSEELNKCITLWLQKNYPEELTNNLFLGCCNENELKMLTECFNIIRSQQNFTKTNAYSILRAIIVYYYILIVMDYTHLIYTDYKYIYVDYIRYDSENNKIEIVNEENNIYGTSVYDYDNIERFLDESGKPVEFKIDIIDNNNDDGIRIIYMPKDMKSINDIEVQNNKIKIYYKKDKPVINKRYLACFDYLLENYPDAIVIYQKLIISEEPWVKEIRKKIMNFNVEPYIDTRPKDIIPLKQWNGNILPEKEKNKLNDFTPKTPKQKKSPKLNISKSPGTPKYKKSIGGKTKSKTKNKSKRKRI